MKIYFVKTETEADGIKTFWFKPESKIRYDAGQFARFYLPGTVNLIEGSREFTLSSSPTEELISFTTRLGRNPSQFKNAIMSLKSGSEIIVDEPIGDFVIPKNPDIPLIFISGGIGVTPVRSIVKDLHDRSLKRKLSLINIAPYKEGLAFSRFFKSSDIIYLPKKVDMYESWLDKNGMVLNATLTPHVIYNPGAYIYISGSQDFVNHIKEELKSIGVSDLNIIIDTFTGY